MPDFHDDHVPDDLKHVVRRLEDHQVDVDPVELDQLKQAALARRSSRPGRRPFMKARIATVLSSLALIAAGGGAFAVARSGDSHPNTHGGAADTQYKPGKGCGDKNHQHQDEDKCKKQHP